MNSRPLTLILPTTDTTHEAPPTSNLFASPALGNLELAPVVELNLVARRKRRLRDGIGNLVPLARLEILVGVRSARRRGVLLVVLGEVGGLEGVGEVLAQSAGHAAEMVGLDAVAVRVSSAGG